MLALFARFARGIGRRSSGRSADPSTQRAEQNGLPLDVHMGHVGTGSAPPSADPVPTPMVITGRKAGSRTGGRRPPAAPEQAAADYLAWVFSHGLDDRIWVVDEVWFLATEDFAVATDAVLPPRNLFLGALKRRHGVRCQYDKRVRVGSKSVKTTIYAFSQIDDLGAVQAQAPADRAKVAA